MVHRRHPRADLPQAGVAHPARDWARRSAWTRRSLTLAEATALCERAAIAAGAIAWGRAVDRPLGGRGRSRRPAERRARAFHRLSRGARSRPHRRQGGRRDHPAGAGDHPFRRQGRGRASRLRRRLRPDRRGGAANSGWRCSRRRTPIPAARSAISPAGSPSKGWRRSPPPTARRCLPAPARPGRSIAPTRWPSPRRWPAARR